jgi:hypothetical protein
MEMIKQIFLFGWYGPPLKLEKARTACAPRTATKKLQYLERDIPLPKEFRLNSSQRVLNVLCEDAVLFYTVRRLPSGQRQPLPCVSSFLKTTRFNMRIGTRFEH